jgi:hypothetical protein
MSAHPASEHPEESAKSSGSQLRDRNQVANDSPQVGRPHTNNSGVSNPNNSHYHHGSSTQDWDLIGMGRQFDTRSYREREGKNNGNKSVKHNQGSGTLDRHKP